MKDRAGLFGADCGYANECVLLRSGLDLAAQTNARLHHLQMRHVLLVAASALMSLTACGAPSPDDPEGAVCNGVDQEYMEHELAANDYSDQMQDLYEAFGPYPDTEKAAEIRALAVNWMAEKRLQARMITNDRDCFSASELAVAQEFLEDPTVALANAMSGPE